MQARWRGRGDTGPHTRLVGPPRPRPLTQRRLRPHRGQAQAPGPDTGRPTANGRKRRHRGRAPAAVRTLAHCPTHGVTLRGCRAADAREAAPWARLPDQRAEPWPVWPGAGAAPWGPAAAPGTSSPKAAREGTERPRGRGGHGESSCELKRGRSADDSENHHCAFRVRTTAVDAGRRHARLGTDLRGDPR